MAAEQVDALEEVSLVRKVLAVSAVAIMCSGALSQLVAQERAAQPASNDASVEWLSVLWQQVGAWFVVPAAGADLEGGCWVDPNGGCLHDQETVKSSFDGGCWVDPLGGCPNGG
jgi:hypothetical protein